MLNKINMQSHNEVKELLNDYVVSPLNSDISKTFSKIVELIEVLEETTKVELSQSSSTFTNRIDYLKRKLDTSYHFDDDEDVFEILKESIRDSIEISSKKTLKQLNVVTSDIKETVEKSKKEIYNLISSSDDKVKNEFDDISSELSSIVSQINKLSLEYKTSNEELSKLITLKYDTLSKLMCQVLELLEAQSDKIKCSINELDTLVSEEIKNINEIQKQQNDDINSKLEANQSQILEIYAKQSKKQFIISLSLGISNLIGIIAIILIFFFQ